jgi:hypothetical protein
MGAASLPCCPLFFNGGGRCPRALPPMLSYDYQATQFNHTIQFGLASTNGSLICPLRRSRVPQQVTSPIDIRSNPTNTRARALTLLRRGCSYPQIFACAGSLTISLSGGHDEAESQRRSRSKFLFQSLCAAGAETVDERGSANGNFDAAAFGMDVFSPKLR